VSYNCQVCHVHVPPRCPRRTYAVQRDLGNRTEIEREIPVCLGCSLLLEGGIPLAVLQRRHGPPPRRTAPALPPGGAQPRRRIKFRRYREDPNATVLVEPRSETKVVVASPPAPKPAPVFFQPTVVKKPLPADGREGKRKTAPRCERCRKVITGLVAAAGGRVCVKCQSK